MKKSNLIICVFIFLIACGKKEESLDTTKENEMFSQVFKAKNIEQQKVLYRTFTSLEKSNFWKYKFNKILSSSNNLNSMQRKLIENTKKLCTETLFQNSSNGNLAVLENLKREAISLFGVQDAYTLLCTVETNLVTTVNTEVQGGDDGIGGEGPGQDCNCSRNSDWCSGKTECMTTMGPYTCSPSNSGCGTFWQYSCNGTCQ